MNKQEILSFVKAAHREGWEDCDHLIPGDWSKSDWESAWNESIVKQELDRQLKEQEGLK